jgi:hypothetical protein
MRFKPSIFFRELDACINRRVFFTGYLVPGHTRWRINEYNLHVLETRLNGGTSSDRVTKDFISSLRSYLSFRKT